MKVIIRGEIYDASKMPIMIILSQKDKKNIKNMSDECNKYIAYPDTFSELDVLELFDNIEDGV